MKAQVSEKRHPLLQLHIRMESGNDRSLGDISEDSWLERHPSMDFPSMHSTDGIVSIRMPLDRGEAKPLVRSQSPNVHVQLPPVCTDLFAFAHL